MNLQEISESTINVLSDFPDEYTGRIIKTLAAMQPKPQDLMRPLEKLAIEKNIPKYQLYELLSVYIAIIKYFIHSTEKDFVSTLVELGFSNKFVDSLPFTTNRKEFDDTFFIPHSEYFQNVCSIRWRIDISLLHSSLLSKTVPNIILTIEMKTGKSYTVELNPKAFHMLRFNIALILKEMKYLKLNPSLIKMTK